MADTHATRAGPVTKHKQPLTDIQLARSARLIGDLAVLFDFPARAPQRRSGIASTSTSAAPPVLEGVVLVAKATTRARTDTYARLAKRAHDFARWGFRRWSRLTRGPVARTRRVLKSPRNQKPTLSKTVFFWVGPHRTGAG